MGDIKRLIRRAGLEPRTCEVEIDGQTFAFKGFPDTEFWISIHSPDTAARDAQIDEWQLAFQQMFRVDYRVHPDDVWKIKTVARYMDPPVHPAEIALLSIVDSKSFLEMFAAVAQMILGIAGDDSEAVMGNMVSDAVAGNSQASTGRRSSSKRGASRRPEGRSADSKQKGGPVAR